jgi:hypothetical protein
MDDVDVMLRNRTYGLFVELGRAPSLDEAASAAGLTKDEAAAGWQRLHDAHALVLHADSMALRMANPFAAQETPFRVHAAGRSWYANCAWDAFGICAALDTDGRIQTRCPDCGDEINAEVLNRRPDIDPGVVFHCLVPASHWWDDIVFS